MLNVLVWVVCTVSLFSSSVELKKSIYRFCKIVLGSDIRLKYFKILKIKGEEKEWLHLSDVMQREVHVLIGLIHHSRYLRVVLQLNHHLERRKVMEKSDEEKWWRKVMCNKVITMDNKEGKVMCNMLIVKIRKTDNQLIVWHNIRIRIRIRQEW